MFDPFMKIKKIVNSFAVRVVKHMATSLSDELYTRIMFWLKVGYRLDLKHPTTFFEKIQWLKLYDHRPEYTIMADKQAVKEWVSDRVGEGHVVPTLGVWENVDDIDYDSLPESFVLKTTHDNGGGVICPDKKNFNRQAAEKKLRFHMNRDFYAYTKEWPYKNIPRRIIAEKYLENESGSLIDYKVFCMGGTPYFTLVVCDRYKDIRFAVYDVDWQEEPFLFDGFRHSERKIPAPRAWREMYGIAKKLSEGIPFVRVDFYEVNGHVFVGEMTFSPAAGFSKFTPNEYDLFWGSKIPLDEDSSTK